MQEQFQQLWSAVCSGEAPAKLLCDWLEEYVEPPEQLVAWYHEPWAEPDPYWLKIVATRYRPGRVWSVMLSSAYWKLYREAWDVETNQIAPVVTEFISWVQKRNKRIPLT
jgi:hypothetical protein